MITVIVNSIVLATALFLIWRYWVNPLLTPLQFSIAVLIKGAFAVFSIYYYRSGDIVFFIRDGELLSQLAYEDVSQYFNILLHDDYGGHKVQHQFYYWPKPRAFFVAKIVSVFNFATDSNKWLNALWLSLFNLVSVFYLISKIKIFYPKYAVVSVMVLLFIPSIVFNTSGLQKEVISMFSLYLMAGVGISLLHHKYHWKDMLLMALGMFFLWKVKYYLLLPFFVCYIPIYLFHIHLSKPVKLVMGIIMIGATIYSARFLHPTLKPYDAFLHMTRNNHEIQERSAEGKFIPYSFEHYTGGELAVNIPKAFFYGLFGPFLWGASNEAMLYIGFENLIFLLLHLFYLFAIFKRAKHSYSVGVLLFYGVALVTILALYSPNYGSLTRYKVAAVPVLWILLLGELHLNPKFSFLFSLFSKNKTE